MRDYTNSGAAATIRETATGHNPVAVAGCAAIWPLLRTGHVSVRVA
jgi:hypothetical protein